MSWLYKLQPFTRYHLKAVTAFITAVSAGWGIMRVVGAQGMFADLSAVLISWILYFGLIWAMGPAPEERRALEKWRKRIRLGSGWTRN